MRRQVLLELASLCNDARLPSIRKPRPSSYLSFYAITMEVRQILRTPMADSLYLSLWYSRFDTDDMLPQAVTVIQQFPFSAQRPGITYLALHPVSWNEPTILERRFEPAVNPEEAILIAS